MNWISKFSGILLVVLSSGCATNVDFRKIERLEVKSNERITKKEDFLREYFTDKAFERLRKIRVLELKGHSMDLGGFSKFGHDLYLKDIIKGYNGRIIAINSDSIKDKPLEYLIHEYVHQAEDLGFISRSMFNERYERLLGDINQRRITGFVEYYSRDERAFRKLNGKLALFDRDSERIALLGQMIVIGENVPDFMKEVYKRVLK
jgi:hypothetical protein